MPEGKLNQVVKDIRFYLDVLKSEECFCECVKNRRHALCWRCYKQLPERMQRDLWQAVRCGFEEAYDAAVEWLN